MLLLLQNRHGKNSSKETGASDPNVKVLESSPRGSDCCTKHDELLILNFMFESHFSLLFNMQFI